MSLLRAELITDLAAIGPIEADWRGLAVERSNGFITPEWLRSWWEIQGNRASSLLISVARRADGTLAGVMPLVLDQSSHPRAIRFAGAMIGDRFYPAASKADEAAVAAATMWALEAANLDQHMILLECADTASEWWRVMQRTSPVKRTIVEQQQTMVPFIDLGGLDWESYLATRSKNFRKQVRRGERNLIREHAMRLRSASDRSLETDLAELFRLHDLRRSGLGGSSLNAAARRSLAAFALAAQRHGWLRLTLMEADGAPVSALLAWRVGASYVSYQGGFDPAWARQSVGFALEAMNIRAAIEEGAGEYDFLLGSEDWKHRFTADARPTQTAVLLRARRPTRVLVAAEAQARRALGSGVRERSHLRGLARSLHGLIPTARGF